MECGRRHFRTRTTGYIDSIFRKRPGRSNDHAFLGGFNTLGFSNFNGFPLMLSGRDVYRGIHNVRVTRKLGPIRRLRKSKHAFAVRVRANANGACACVGAVCRLGTHCN